MVKSAKQSSSSSDDSDSQNMPKKIRKLENDEATITKHRTPKKERIEKKEVKKPGNPRKRNAPFRRVIDEDITVSLWLLNKKA